MMYSTENLTSESFKDYGDVITLPSSNSTANGICANQGTAKRVNHLTQIIQLSKRPSGKPAKLNPCLFVSSAQCKNSSNFSIHLLERHLFSTQLFLPCNSDKGAKYLVIVCLNGPVHENSVAEEDTDIQDISPSILLRLSKL